MKIFRTAFLFFALMITITGFLYPLSMTLLAKAFFPIQSKGSLIKNEKAQVIGSAWVGQNFQQEIYFWPRPSVINYNPMPSGGSNSGPTSETLRQLVNERKKAGFTAEMLYASASGLDPHVTPPTALKQAPRVAKARGLQQAAVEDLILQLSESRQMGFLGVERINILKLNIALDHLR